MKAATSFTAVVAALTLLAGCALPRERPRPLADSGSVAVRCGRLIDGVSNDVRIDQLVLIRNGRFSSVRPASSAPRGLKMLDLSSSTCLPGLIDMHVHLTDRPEDTADLTVYYTRSREESLALGKRHAAATLLAGFTSVRNVGTYVQGTDQELRDAINAGQAIGPRLYVSGPYLTIPQGGGDLFVPDYREPADNARFHAGVAQGAQQFRDRAQAISRDGADLLKVIASGAVLAFGGVPGSPEMNRAEIAAVVEVAHRDGKKVAAHAHGADSIRMAIEAGVDTIEHASYLDEAGIALALRRGHLALGMDVYNGDYIDTEGRKQNWPEEFLRKNIETTEIQRLAFSKAVAAGVPIIYATDAGVFPHGLNARQFRIMVARGMTPMQAIKAATSVAAEYLGTEAGVIAPGKSGDLIAVRTDPLADITVLEEVSAVIKGGVIYKQ